MADESTLMNTQASQSRPRPSFWYPSERRVFWGVGTVVVVLLLSLLLFSSLDKLAGLSLQFAQKAQGLYDWVRQNIGVAIVLLFLLVGIGIAVEQRIYTAFFQARHLAWAIYKARLWEDPTRILEVLPDIFHSDNARMWLARGVAELQRFAELYEFLSGGRLEQAGGDTRTQTLEKLAVYCNATESVAAVVRQEAQWSRKDQISSEDVQQMAEVLEKHAAVLRWGVYIASFWRCLVAAMNVRTVQDLLAQAGKIEETASLLRQPDFFRPELATVLNLELESIGFLRRYVTAGSLEGQVAFLTKALESLERARAHTEANVSRPEQDVLRIVLGNWTSIFRTALEGLQGTAQLRLVFKSQQVERQAEIVLLADLMNEGRGYAEAVTLTLLPGEGYTQAELPVSPALLDLLPSHTTQPIRFQLHPHAQERFVVSVGIRYRDMEEREQTFTEQISLVDRASTFVAFDNPYKTGAPIRERESKVFYGRDDAFRDIAKILDENSQTLEGKSLILLVGERRMGKTSVLLQLDHQLPERYVPVFLDVQGFNDPGDAAFLYWMGVRVVRKMRERGAKVDLPSLQALQEAPTTLFEAFLADSVLPVLDNQHLVLLFDEFEHMQDLLQQKKQEPGILLFLRDLMQHVPRLSFIFAGTFRLQEMASEHQSIMFNIARTLKLDYLSEADTKRLVTEPVADVLAYEPGALDYLYLLTRGHPFFTQLLCYEVVEQQKKQKKVYTTVTDIEEAVRHMIDTGQAHFTYIFETLSPAERLVLSGLAKWMDGQRPVIASDLVSQLGRYRIEASLYDIARLLDQLAQRGLLIEQRRREGSDYAFRMELIRRWLVRHRPFEEVLSQEGASGFRTSDVR